MPDVQSCGGSSWHWALVPTLLSCPASFHFVHSVLPCSRALYYWEAFSRAKPVTRVGIEKAR